MSSKTETSLAGEVRAPHARRFRSQVALTLLVALVAFVAITALHVGQRAERSARVAALGAFRTARLDVSAGFAHVLGAAVDDAPFDRTQGIALLAQGLDEVESSELLRRDEPRHQAEIQSALDAARAVLVDVRRSDASDPLPIAALRVAVGRLDTVTGRLDAEAELDLGRVTEEQDALFTATLAATTGLVALVFLLLRRTALGADGAERARSEAEVARREVEAREHETAQRLRAVVEGTTDAVFVKDREGRYVFVNEAAARMMGKPVEAIVGSTDAQIFDAASSMVVDAHHAEVLEGGFVSTREKRLVLRGEPRILSATVAPRRDAEGRIVGIVGISRDVTEQRVLEAQLRQAQKMEAVGRLAGGVAHDFNNLLTVINSYTELLADDLAQAGVDVASDAGSAAHESVEAIREAGQRATALTAQLLAFSRKAIVAPRPVELGDAVRASERLLRRILGEDVTLSTNLSSAPCVVTIDPTQLDQILMNLAVNARDAMPRGGTLELATSIVVLTEGPHAGTPGVDAWAELTVADSGLGMSAEVRSHIFEPFFTTKAQGQGTGLGLSVIDGIVAQAGGHIEVESTEGVGTRFFVRLPLADAAPRDSDVPGVRSDLHGTETVLLAEDDELVRTLARNALVSRGYRVLTAADGDEALSVAAAHAGTIDALVCDVVMPKRSGRDVADRIRATRPTTRVLFVSGYTDDAVLRHGVAAGRDPFLAKPFTPRQLAMRVRELLDAPSRAALHAGERAAEAARERPDDVAQA